MKGVFLSYSHSDEYFVEDLYARLTRDGVQCFFDKASIKWGENWVVALEKGIDECDFIVLVLSPDFCESKWTELERTSFIADDPDGFKRKLRPIMLKPCSSMLPRFLKPIQHIDVSTTDLFEKNYPRICRELGGESVIEFSSTDRKKLPSVSKLPARHRMPYRSLGNSFVGRIDDLWKIHDILNERKTAVVEGVGIVMGTGGIGKTQLAIEYVHRFGVNYRGGLFWLEADQGMARMVVQLSEAAGIDIDTTLREKDQLEQLWRKLSGSTPVLIVLDNFPEKEPLQPWIAPEASIYTLVTTRRRDLGGYSRIPLEFMDLEEGVRLLNLSERTFGAEVEPLVTALGGLPLALELARNFLNLRPSLEIEELLTEMKRIGEMKTLDLFSKKYIDELPSGHTQEVAATFQMSWDLASPAAQSVLQYMSLLAPSPVPQRLIRKILKFTEKNILEDPLDEAVGELSKNLSLIELDEENNLWVHRLISAFVRTVAGNIKEFHDKVVSAVRDEMKRVSDEKDILSYRQLEMVLPHADILLHSDFIKPDDAIDLSNYLSWHYMKSGQYRLSEEYGRKSLEFSEDSFKPGHPSIATSQSNLALVLQDLGELEEARDLLRKALASDEKSFEPGHPSIATSQSNLALVLKDLGELEEARDLLRKALASDEKSFEPGHPSIATRQSNLALVLKDLGELEEARDLLRKALASAEKSFEPGHPSIATSQSNLAMVLQDLGELEEARDLLRKALASAEKSFEPGHPSIATSQSNLAMVLQDLGELEEARDLAKQSYETFLKKLGPQHPYTKITKRNWESI